MTHHDTAHEDSEDRFYAQFDSREVELMTLDELQSAFEAGQIHENTFVCREGSSEWLTLAEVAGLGEEEEEEAPLVAPALPTRPAMPARGPDVIEAAAPAGQGRPPMPARRPELSPGVEVRPSLPERRPEMNTVPAARFQAAAAQSIPPAAPATTSPLSFAPVTSNIDLASLDMDDELALRPKRRWGVVLAAAAALAVAGGGTVFALGSQSAPVAAAEIKPSTVAASPPPASPTLAEVEKPSEPVVPPATPAAEAAPEAPKSTPQFSDDMKQALLAADKGRVTKKAQKLKAHAAAPAPRRAKAAGSAGLKSSGSAYDPLNGNL